MTATFRRPLTFTGWLYLITLAGLVLRIVYVLVIERGDPLSGDGAGYHHQANLIADGKGFIEPFRFLFGNTEEIIRNGVPVTVETPIGHVEPTAGHPPVWIVMMGAVSFLGFTSVLSHQLASAVFGALSIIVMGYLGREVAGERAGLIAAALTASYAFIWINDGLIMAETAAITAAAATSLVGIRFWRNPTTRLAVIFGIVGAISGLARAELILFLPIVAAVALLRSDLTWRRRLQLYAVAGFVAVAVVAPWVIRNMTEFEEPVLLSNGVGTVLVQSNCDDTYYGPKLGYWQLECGLPQPYGPNGELLDESERDIVVRDRATDYINAHRRRLVTVVVPARIGRMWAIYDPIDQLRLDELVERRSFSISVLGLVQYYTLLPLAMAGAVILWRRKGPLLAVGLWPILATITAASTFGNTRYRTAAEVTIVILAAVTCEWLWARFHTGTEQPADESTQDTVTALCSPGRDRSPG